MDLYFAVWPKRGPCAEGRAYGVDHSFWTGHVLENPSRIGSSGYSDFRAEIHEGFGTEPYALGP